MPDESLYLACSMLDIQSMANSACDIVVKQKGCSRRIVYTTCLDNAEDHTGCLFVLKTAHFLKELLSLLLSVLRQRGGEDLSQA